MRTWRVCIVAAFVGWLTGMCEWARADYRSAVEALNPTHYWRLDETTGGAGTIAVDSAGDVDGTYAGNIGPELGELGVEGPEVNIAPGNVAFNANNMASVDIGPGAAMAAPTMTIAAWFRENGSEGGDRLWTNNQTDPNTSFQIFFGGGTGVVAANIGIGLNPAVNGFPAEGLPSGPGVGNFHIQDLIVPVKDNQWHHIVASRNGNNIENVIVVIDGVHYGPDMWSDSTDTWGTTGDNAQIATRTPPDGGGSLQALNGPVDEVAVWLNRQLTVAEAIGLYNAAIGATTPGDLDVDGDVDGEDFLVLQRGMGTLYDADDVAAFRANYGAGGVGGAVAVGAVPEPAALTLLALCSLGVFARRGR
jgi:hypothetical protein